MSTNYDNKILKDMISFILETAHDANVGGGYGRAGGYTSTNQTLGGLSTKGASIFPYLEEPTEIEEDEDEYYDDIIMSILSKTDGFRPNFDPNNQRKDNRTLGSTPLGEARWAGLGASQLPQNSTEEPVYDFSDILGNASNGRGNIDKIKKLTWILQNSDE